MPIVQCKIKVPNGTVRGDIKRVVTAEDWELQLCKFPNTGKGHEKGFAWERKFAKDLSLWLSDGEDGCIFERRSGSGGSKRDKQNLSGEGGDIVAIKQEGKIVTDRIFFELKFYENLTGDLWSLVAGEPTDRIVEWWESAVVEADSKNKKTVLILRCNYRKPLVLTNATKIFTTKLGSICTLKLLGNTVWCFPLEDWFDGEHRLYPLIMFPIKYSLPSEDSRGGRHIEEEKETEIKDVIVKRPKILRRKKANG